MLPGDHGQGRPPDPANASIERLVNMFVQKTPEGAEYPYALRRFYGLSLSDQNVGATIRRLHVMHREAGDAYLFAVASGSIYRSVGPDVTSFGAAAGSAISATDNVSMADNGVHCVISTGVTGNNLQYIAAAGGPTTIATVSAIRALCYMDGYLIGVKNNTNEFYISDPDDATVWSATAFSTADAFPDVLVGCAAEGGLLHLFGLNHIEIWQNTGNALFPFERVPGGIIKIGLVADGNNAVVAHGGRLFFPANDHRVYTGVGTSFEPVSTPPIEHRFSSGIEGYISRSIDGRAFYVLDEQNDFTLAYDIDNGIWCELSSQGTDGGLEGRACVSMFSGNSREDYYAAINTDNLLVIDHGAPGSYNDNSDSELVRECIIVTPPISAGGRPIFFDEFMLEVETGVSSVTESGANYPPEVSLEWTDNNGSTWSNPVYRPVGFSGEYNQRVSWCGLGRSPRQRSFRIKYSHNSPFNVIGAKARISVGP